MIPSTSTEELLTELAAMRRLINQLTYKLEQLRGRLRKEASPEPAARRDDEDDGSD